MNVELGGPSKSGYKFSEVTSLTGVKPYVLRFWETEFEHIKPATNDHGQKVYSPHDIDTIQKVKRLLFDDKLTIPQAKGYLDRDIIDFEIDEEEMIPGPEVMMDMVSEPSYEDEMVMRSEQLKAALDAIIDKNSIPEIPAAVKKADDAVISIKKELVGSKLIDRDVVNLVTAKKKLNIVLGKIDQIAQSRGWN